ncbi:MAG: tetratricopeptide repeat protein [Verrucomicrobiota bacterium]
MGKTIFIYRVAEEKSGKSKPEQKHRTWYRRERRRERIRRWSLITAVLLLAGAVVWRESRGLTAKWRERNAVRSAQLLLEQGNYSRAAPLLREAMRLNPNNLEACRRLADLQDRAESPEALALRQRVNQLEPGNVTNLLALAHTALRQDEWLNAEQALASIEEKQRNTVTFHELAAEVAVAAKRPFSEAEFHYSKAGQLDPANELLQLNLAKVQLSSNKAETREMARQALERLKSKSEFRTLALRALVADAAQSGEDPAALSMARELAANPRAKLSDRLLLLDILWRRRMPELNSDLNRLQQEVISRPQDIDGVIFWMNRHGLAAEAVAWGKGLPPDLANLDSIWRAISESLTSIKDWKMLEEWLESSTGKQSDFIRLAYSARVNQEKSQAIEADNKWRMALHAVHGDPERLIHLANLASAWAWDREAEDLWWLIAKGETGQRQRQRPALIKLYELNQVRGDAPGLCRVSRALYQLNPNDSIGANNVAYYSLLLSLDRAIAEQLTKENFVKDPKNPAFLLTYVFLLYQQGQNEEAVKLFDGFSDEELKEGRFPLVYGLVAAARGKPEVAKQFFALAEKNPNLLPEEKSLISQAGKAVKPASHSQTTPGTRQK